MAPRITLTGVGLDLPDLIKQLSDQLPIDQQKVFVMGHSMGAGFTIRSVSQLADRDDDFRFAAGIALWGMGLRQIDDLDNQLDKARMIISESTKNNENREAFSKILSRQ